MGKGFGGGRGSCGGRGGEVVVGVRGSRGEVDAEGVWGRER